MHAIAYLPDQKRDLHARIVWYTGTFHSINEFQFRAEILSNRKMIIAFQNANYAFFLHRVCY